MTRTRHLTLSFALALGLAGCAGEVTAPDETLDGTQQPIVNGTVDNADPSVVLLFNHAPSDSNGAVCTGTLVAPTTILTAAHCVDPALNGTGTVIDIYPDQDFQNGKNPTARASGYDFDRQFNHQQLDSGHDVAVVLLAAPLPGRTPLPIYRAQPATGSPVRIVGYGVSNGTAQTGAGTKRQGSTRIASISSTNLLELSGTSQTCQGDSGGPAFLKEGTTEYVAGVTSYGYGGCGGSGYDTGVFAYTSFLDKYLGGAPTGGGSTGGSTGGGGGSTGGGGGSTGGGSTGGGGGSTAPSAGASEQEPNDTPDQADTLGADGTIAASIGSSSDVDWFAWGVPANVTYTIDVSGLAGQFTLYKLVSGTSLSRIGSDTTSLSRYTSTGGTYYLKVTGTASKYTLAVSVQ